MVAPSSVYAQFSSRSRTVLLFGCLVMGSGIAISYAVEPLAGLIVLVCTWSPGLFLIGLALKLRQLDLRRSMSAWFYHAHGMILPGDTLRRGISFSPRGLFGDWRFVLPAQADATGERFLTVVREGRGHVLYESGVLVREGVGVR